MYWQLYVVKHKVGTFIGVACSVEGAREHWGTDCEIKLITDPKEILDIRLTGPERIFIAV